MNKLFILSLVCSLATADTVITIQTDDPGGNEHLHIAYNVGQELTLSPICCKECMEYNVSEPVIIIDEIDTTKEPHMIDTIKEKAQVAGEKVQNAIHTAKDTIESAAHTVGDKATQAAHVVKNATVDSAHAIKNTAVEMGRVAKKGAIEVKESIKNANHE